MLRSRRGYSVTEFRLETERLVLREWRADDANDLHRLHCDPRVMATLGPVGDFAFTVALIADLRERSRRNGGFTFWAAERKDDARVIGFCGLDRGHEGTIVGELEIGWRLAHDFWGRGYAREAALACLDWAERNLADERVVAVTSRINARSRGLMERLGMTHRPELAYEYDGLGPDDPLRPHVTYVKEIAR